MLRESRHAILEFTPELHKIFDVIQSFNNLRIVDANKDTAGFIPTIMEETLLLPGDCIRPQTMLNQNCRAILSTDPDFDGIREITRMKPREIK